MATGTYEDRRTDPQNILADYIFNPTYLFQSEGDRGVDYAHQIHELVLIDSFASRWL